MVEDFPEPVGRVASTTPLFRLAISPAAQVTGDLAKLGMLSGMSRITMAWLPRYTEDVHAKATVARDAVRNVAGSLLLQPPIACLLPPLSSSGMRQVSSRSSTCDSRISPISPEPTSPEPTGRSARRVVRSPAKASGHARR